MHTLDWNHAWIGRLPQPTPPGKLPRLESCAARLAGELAAGTLPFLCFPYREELISQLLELTPFIKRFRHMVVLGIGGSALGARALQKAFAPRQDRPDYNGPFLTILDNIDAESLENVIREFNPGETLLVPISKSGGTIETLAQYFLLRRWMRDALPNSWQEHFLVITDIHKGYLREEVEREGFKSLTVPDHLGGRYSVLSAVGLVPAVFMGLPWQDLLEGAFSITGPLVNNPGSAENLAAHPAWVLANWCHELYQKKYSQLIFFSYIPAWAAFGQWFGQLWAESLGKDGKGTMPLPAVGVTDQHSLQQMFLDGPKDKGCLLLSCPGLNTGPKFPDDIPENWSWLHGKSFGDLLQAEHLGTSAALAHFNVPQVGIRLTEATPRTAGELMGLCMATTLLTGWLLEIDPLDQPAVELGKRLACSRLGSTEYPEEAAMLKAFMG